MRANIALTYIVNIAKLNKYCTYLHQMAELTHISCKTSVLYDPFQLQQSQVDIDFLCDIEYSAPRLHVHLNCDVAEKPVEL